MIDAELRAVVLREFQPICSVAPKKVILREAPSYIGRVEFARRRWARIRFWWALPTTPAFQVLLEFIEETRRLGIRRCRLAATAL